MRLIVAGMLLVGIAAASCAPRSSTHLEDGATRFAITLSPNVVIDKVDYRILGPAFDVAGTIDVTGEATVSLLVSNIPPGTGYLLEASATSTDGKISCAGQARFDIQPGATTLVFPVLACRGPASGNGSVIVNGRFNSCPTLDTFTGAPLQAEIGGDITLRATASDADNNPLVFTWHSSEAVGTFSNPAAASTVFTCTAASATTLTVTVSDGVCAVYQEVTVTCAAPFCLLDQTYSFSISHGLVSREERGFLRPSATANIEMIVAGQSASCTPTLPECGTPGVVDMDDIANAILHPDVQAALARDRSEFGDRFLADADIFLFGRPGGGSLSIIQGGECTRPTSSACVPAPPGVKRLAAGIRALVNLAAQDPACLPGPPPTTCRSCAEHVCGEVGAGCDAAALADPSDKALCQAAYNCFVASRCTTDGDPTRCLCGDSGSSCATPGAANGPCLSEAVAASKSPPGRADIVFARFANPLFPIGRATAQTGCEGSAECKSFCGIP